MTGSGVFQLKRGDGLQGILTFSSASVTGTPTVEIKGWSGTTSGTGTAGSEDKIIIASAGTAFANTVIFRDVNGISGNDWSGFWRSGTGEVVPLSAVPEPGTILAGTLLVGLLGWSERRRIAPLLKFS